MDITIIPNYFVQNVYGSCLFLPTKIRFTGQNQSKISILYNDAINTSLLDKEQQFLENFLKACGFTLEDISLINLFNQPINYVDLMQQCKPTTVIMFGIEIPKLIHLPNFSNKIETIIINNCNYLLCPNFPFFISTNKDIPAVKKMIWVALKKIFNL